MAKKGSKIEYEKILYSKGINKTQKINVLSTKIGSKISTIASWIIGIFFIIFGVIFIFFIDKIWMILIGLLMIIIGVIVIFAEQKIRKKIKEQDE